MTKTTLKHESGFTLVELSIVLVIIGLIVGGVLVGQDMIKAAEIRSTISQVESFNTAANVFRDKYEQLPGDVSSSKATTLGLTTRTGAAGRGDGNGLIQSAATTGATSMYLGYETGLFWRDLNQMSLVEGTFDQATDAFPTAALTVESVKSWMPEAKLKHGNMITVYTSGGKNYFEVSGITSVAVTGIYTLKPSLTPQEAMGIDQKMDDGRPLTGNARAAYSTAALDGIQAKTASIATGTLAAGAVTDCINGDATTTTSTDPYNVVNDDNASQLACQLRLRAGF
jgi:prepilin-type N-terminal cleavage/methylation domain-containing protein